MEIHRQTCQQCGSLQVKNILVREDGSLDHVYVQCHSCKEFVARYIIAHQGYYHHGKGFESYLSGLNRGGDFESGKDLQAEFEKIKETCVAKFNEVLKTMSKLKKD